MHVESFGNWKVYQLSSKISSRNDDDIKNLEDGSNLSEIFSQSIL